TRKTKLLVEKYDSETSKFQVQMEESDKYIKTYFIVGPKSKPATPNLNTSSEHSGSRSSISEDKHDADSIVVDGLNSPNLSEPRRPSLRTQILDSHNDTQAPNGVTPAFLLGRRQSGFFAISEMSLEEIAEEEKEGMEVDSTMVPINETLTKTRQLRQQTDKQLIHYIQEDTENNSDYFYKPPINQCTLTFKTAGLEKRYREHYLDDDNQQLKVKTFASPRFNAFIDMVISFIFLVAISICCFIVFGITMPWVTYFVVAMVFEVVMLIPYIKDVLIEAPARGCLERIRRCISLWYMRHVLGAVLTSLPAAAVYANFSCAQEEDQQKHAIFYCYLLLVALLHYCNFTMLSSWMKSILASLVGIVLLLLLGIGVCSESQYHNVYNVTSSSFNLTNNETIWQNYTAQIKLDSNVLFSGKHKLRFEIILDMALLLLLVWFLNREFEVSYRLGFHGDEEASADRSRMEIEKKHADWLLHNIIPEHISEQLKKTSKYSKNHKNVGVIFASIVNFHEFYDESYEGGRECLRVLNELVGNFEELLGDSRFKDVEKIKTIGHTLMVASGLNEQTRLQNRHPNAHLYTLLDYTIEMQHVVQQFNEGMLEFGFVLSIGFYCGEVTSGVIGTSKLLYDIWGDTVNIASRMYSTGMPGRIQLPEGTANMLEDKFEFEHRGTVFVKGKGDMRTCFLLHKREGAQWD
ncbi:adenylate cyclase type 9-like, partial [Lingula anatina]|uniref:adenylate cyclase n=2 Tax=Lingula anatina TaxID=7574 RepID=A0A1S3J5F8_LINAN